MTVAPCGEKDGQVMFEVSHFHEGLGHGEREMQELRQQR